MPPGKGVDGERGAGVGDVVGGDEGGELLVGGEDLGVDGRGDGIGEALLVGVGEGGGELAGGDEEGVGLHDAVALRGDFLGDEADGDEVVLDADAEDVFGLEEGAGDLVKARDVVFIVLHGVEGHGEREVGDAGVNASSATGGAERHFVVFEVVVVHRFLEVAQEEVVGDAIGIGETFGGDGLDAGEISGVDLVATGVSGESVVAELVVVAVVADRGGEGGGELEVGLPGLGEEGVLGGDAGGGGGGCGLGERGGGEQQGGCREEGWAHG